MSDKIKFFFSSNFFYSNPNLYILFEKDALKLITHEALDEMMEKLFNLYKKIEYAKNDNYDQDLNLWYWDFDELVDIFLSFMPSTFSWLTRREKIDAWNELSKISKDITEIEVNDVVQKIDNPYEDRNSLYQMYKDWKKQ